VSNSKPLTDTSLYWAYGERFGGFCEVAFYAGLYAENGKLLPTNLGSEITRDLHKHHLWSVNQRPDFRSNLLTVTKAVHDYFHAHQPEARTIAVLCKLRKRAKLGEPEEFDTSEIFRASGKLVAGVIGGYNFSTNAMLEKFQAECLRGLAEIEREAA
jgi:hypothetical protein